MPNLERKKNIDYTITTSIMDIKYVYHYYMYNLERYNVLHFAVTYMEHYKVYYKKNYVVEKIRTALSQAWCSMRQ